MKKIKFLSKTSRNIFTIPLIVASLLILGVLVYAGLTGTDFRSRAAGNKKIVNPIKRIVPTPQKTKSIIGATVAPKTEKVPTSVPTKSTNKTTGNVAKPEPTCAVKDYGCALGATYCGVGNSLYVCQSVYSNTCNKNVKTWIENPCQNGTCQVVSGVAKCVTQASNPACSPTAYSCQVGYAFCGSNNSVDYNLINKCISTKDTCGKTITTWQSTPCANGQTCVFANGTPQCKTISIQQ